MMVIAFFALLAGYLGIRHFYDAGLPDGADISLISFWTLVFFGFLTGIGGNGGLVGAMNATAKSWPDSRVRLYTTYFTSTDITFFSEQRRTGS